MTHVKKLSSIQRAASSEGEAKAVNYIQGELARQGISSVTEPFGWSKILISGFRGFTLMIALFSIISLLSLVFQIAFIDYIYINLAFLLVVIVVLIIFIRGIKFTSFYHLGKVRFSQNIIAKIPALHAKNPNRPIVIFSSHYDSLYSSFSPRRIRLNLLIITGLIVAQAILIRLVTSPYLSMVMFGITAGFSIYIGVFWRLSNRSSGAIDNASGAAVLLELAKLFKKAPLDHADILFLWCGAEEWGLWGSRYFSFKFFNENTQLYNLHDSYNINLDMIGSYIGLPRKNKSNEHIHYSFTEEAQNAKIPYKKHSILSLISKSDSTSFHLFSKKMSTKRKLLRKKSTIKVFDISSLKDFKFAHTKHDTVEKCSANVLNNCIKLCFRAVHALGSNKN